MAPNTNIFPGITKRVQLRINPNLYIILGLFTGARPSHRYLGETVPRREIMSFEYLMDHPCNVRERLGDNASEIILEAKKNMNKYLVIREGILEDDPNREPDDEIITMQFMSAHGIEEKQIVLGDLRKQFMDIEKRANGCVDCPCNLMREFHGTPETLGCYGMIQYPLSVSYERIVMLATFQVLKKLTDRPAAIFLHYILDHEDIGTRSEAMRTRGADVFFETETPNLVTKKNKIPFINSNQITDMLFGFNIDPDVGAKVYLPFLDIIEDIYQDRIRSEDENTSNDRTIRELLHFRRAIQLGVEHNCTVRTLM